MEKEIKVWLTDIKQAISENLTLITKDKGLKKYKVKQQWT